eukprot:754285-Hanusia_phi.AAC.2
MIPVRPVAQPHSSRSEFAEYRESGAEAPSLGPEGGDEGGGRRGSERESGREGGRRRRGRRWREVEKTRMCVREGTKGTGRKGRRERVEGSPHRWQAWKTYGKWWALEVEFDGEWWDANVKAREGDSAQVLVHYVGGTDEEDEWVEVSCFVSSSSELIRRQIGGARLRKPPPLEVVWARVTPALLLCLLDRGQVRDSAAWPGILIQGSLKNPYSKK